ncbi:AraC family transcriptional regulator [Horticoccus luteus]|uniref:AraC family transcriptional regulator n=1 Tax=Horticoccus luteus TaxID=2862869 RepID=A0A8F9XKH5_9BACT|nr:AraC family transcriptional regulator [Horticoccus luteus]QYM78206.1 AraC family transcriptional regulator [Horticoccus luteus]
MTAARAIGPPPVESIRLVERFERAAPGFAFTATSLPGHLLHLVVAGEVEQSCNGRRQHLTPGALVWYHEDEWVEGRVLRAPWIYYSVNFFAPTLSPPDFAARVRPAQQSLAAIFAALHAAWRQPASVERNHLCHAHLLTLLAAAALDPSAPPPPAGQSRLWWEIEAWARQHLDRPCSLEALCAAFHRSPNTVSRACREAVGLPPMKRLKQIRLSLARGLVQHSDLTMTAIASRIGYARVHEFSRDYRKAFGHPPTADRG